MQFLISNSFIPWCIPLLYSYTKLSVTVILPVLTMVPILQTCLFNTNLELHGELPEHSGFSIYGDKEKDSSIHSLPSDLQHLMSTYYFSPIYIQETAISC